MTDTYNPASDQWDDDSGTVWDLLKVPEWHKDAKCKGKTSMFYPPWAGPEHPAKSICKTCPVRRECLEAGRSEAYGIWGGASARQRRNLRRAGLL